MTKSPLLLRAGLALLALATALHAADPKRVYVCTVTTGFRHSSIGLAEQILQKLGDESHAYTIVDFIRQPEEPKVEKAPVKPKDLAANADDKAKAKYEADSKNYEAQLAQWTPEKQKAVQDAKTGFEAAIKKSLERLAPENLRAQKIDAVIFANTTGDLPLPDKEGFIKWIEDGHAFIGTHSASDTFHHFPGYIQMLGGEFLTHEFQVPADLVQADPSHPADAGLPNPWLIKQEEVYQFKNHDRNAVHVLWFLRHHPNHPEKPDTYAAVSWCKMAGTGRVFYTSLGHREDLWSDDPAMKGRVNSPEVARQYQQHLLGGIKWALGLAAGDATPNPQVK